jgi:hypothetical protein
MGSIATEIKILTSYPKHMTESQSTWSKNKENGIPSKSFR